MDNISIWETFVWLILVISVGYLTRKLSWPLQLACMGAIGAVALWLALSTGPQPL